MIQYSVSIFGPIAIIVGVLLAVGCLWLAQRLLKPEDLRPSHDVAGFMYATIGVIYAVLLAFVVVVVWEQFDNADELSQQEAAHAGDIARLAFAFPDSARVNIQTTMTSYLRAVVDREWDSMELGREDSTTYARMGDLWLAFRHFHPEGRDVLYYQESLREMDEFNDARRMRLIASHSHVPPIMWALLIAGGVLVVAFTYLFSAPKRWPQYAMVSMLTTMIVMTLVLIYALDHPFSGQVRVTSEAFQYVLDRMPKN
jgi:hypothetical protein